MKVPTIKVTPKGLKRVLNGRLWLERKDLAEWPEESPGSEVRLLSPEGYFLARGYFQPKSRIPVRIFSRKDLPLDRSFLIRCFQEALNLRKRVYPGEKAFRLLHAEGDVLPGLTVDVYGKVVVIQISTAGIERVKEEVLAAIQEVLSPETVVFRNDLPVRQEEGLALYVETVGKRLDSLVEVRMDGLLFLIDVLRGQKTGFFLDQRENRRLIQRLSQGTVVLDLFAYTGAFGMYALSGGARRVFAVERSAEALALAEEIARRNGLGENFFPIQARVEEFLRDAPDTDFIILDPPAFIKSYRHRDSGRQKYKEINRLALRTLFRGFFFTSSCSQFLSEEEFRELLRSLMVGRRARLLFQNIQAPDHPENPAHPETLYLKGFTFWLEE